MPVSDEESAVSAIGLAYARTTGDNKAFSLRTLIQGILSAIAINEMVHPRCGEPGSLDLRLRDEED